MKIYDILTVLEVSHVNPNSLFLMAMMITNTCNTTIKLQGDPYTFMQVDMFLSCPSVTSINECVPTSQLRRR